MTMVLCHNFLHFKLQWWITFGSFLVSRKIWTDWFMSSVFMSSLFSVPVTKFHNTGDGDGNVKQLRSKSYMINPFQMHTHTQISRRKYRERNCCKFKKDRIWKVFLYFILILFDFAIVHVHGFHFHLMECLCVLVLSRNIIFNLFSHFFFILIADYCTQSKPYISCISVTVAGSISECKNYELKFRVFFFFSFFVWELA